MAVKKISIPILFLILLTACSSEVVSSKEISTSLPVEIKEKIEKLPEEFINQVETPSKLPGTYILKSFDFTSDSNGNILNTTFIYSDYANHNLVFSTWYIDVSQSRKVIDTVTLKNGNVAEITGDFDISWRNDKGYTHDLSMVIDPNGGRNDFTIDDLIKIANSVE